MDPVVILGTDPCRSGPGQEQRLPVRVRNQGRRVESYRVDVVGAPAPFAEVVPPIVSVLPGREAEVDVIVPAARRRRRRRPARSPFAVRATSEVDASSSAVAEGRLELAGVAGLQAWAPETTRSRAVVGDATTSSSPTRATPRRASRSTAHDPRRRRG